MDKNKKTLGTVVVMVLVIVGSWLLLKGGKPAPDTSPIRIGVSMPLSGEAASYGEAGRAGLELALKEINDAGGIKGRMVELVYEDDKCDSTGVSVFQKLISVDKVTAIIGPVCSAAAGPAIPIARAANIPVLLVGASAPGLTGGDDSIFNSYPTDTFQGRFSAEYIYNTLGKRKVAVMYVQNDWGQGLQKVFNERFTELGGTVVMNEGVAQDATDVKSVAAKIQAAKPDLIYMPAYPALAAIATQQFRDLGMTTPVFGGDALIAKEFLTSPAAEGVMFVTGAVGSPEDFKSKVEALNGRDTVINIVTPLGYDALKMLTQVIAQKGTDSKDIIAGLKALDYKAGVSFPDISFDSSGDLKVATYDVKIVKNAQAVTVPQ